MSRVAPHVVSARLTPTQRATIARAAKACNESLSTFTRQALTARAAGNHGAADTAATRYTRLSGTPARQALSQLVALAANDPTAQIADLCLALGIPATSSPDDIMAAVTALLESLGSDAPTAPDPAPAGPAGGRTVKTSRGEITLSAREIKTCQEVGASLEAYAENRTVLDANRARAPGVLPRAVAAKFEVGPDGNVRLARH
jgi:hypothetical protein